MPKYLMLRAQFKDFSGRKTSARCVWQCGPITRQWYFACYTYICLLIYIHLAVLVIHFVSLRNSYNSVSKVRSNFNIIGMKCGLMQLKVSKISIFWYKFAPKGYIPLSDFYKIWRWGGSPRSAPSRQISALYVWKCGL